MMTLPHPKGLSVLHTEGELNGPGGQAGVDS